jgi:hypothetical protein
MADERDEEARLRDVALQNAQSILAARRGRSASAIRVASGHAGEYPVGAETASPRTDSCSGWTPSINWC